MPIFKATLPISLALSTLGALFAAHPAEAGVITGDTFDIAITGYVNPTKSIYLVDPIKATFGATQTFSGVALGGQLATVSSSESQNLQSHITTDTFTISVPNNFAPVRTTYLDLPIKMIELDLGSYGAGSDTVDLASPIAPSSLSATGFVLLTTANFTFHLGAAFPVLTNNNESLTVRQDVTSTGSIEEFEVHSFSVSISYSNQSTAKTFSAFDQINIDPPSAPEPPPLAVLGVPALVLLRRRKTV
jgi:hypothetical protein